MSDENTPTVCPDDTSPNNPNRLTSYTVGKVALALAKAQGAFSPLNKNCEGKVSYEGRDGKAGGSYTFRYADLAAVVDATREALAANELAIVNVVNHKLGVLRVALLHSSGEWLASDAMIPSAQQVGPQKFGSAFTYMKRYLISGLLGVAADDDDDANAAEGNQLQKTERPRPAPQPKTANKVEHDPVVTAKLSALATALRAAKIADADRLVWMSKAAGRAQVIASGYDLTIQEIDKCFAALNKGGSDGNAA